MELTRYRGRDERGTWGVYEWEGRKVRAYDSMANALRVIEFFSDESLDPLTKSAIFPRLLLVDPEGVRDAVDDMPGLLSMIVWEAFGLDIDGTHGLVPDDRRVIDWDGDAQVIKASLYQVYGLPWDEMARELSFRDVTSMMGLVPHDTPLGQALYYRTADPPEPTGHNDEEIRFFMERQEHWRIKDEPNPDDARSVEAMDQRCIDAARAMYEAGLRNGGRR